MSTFSFNVAAPKESAHLSINGDLLEKAQQLNIDLSATLEASLANMVREKKQLRSEWVENNRAGIEALNEFMDKYGLFSDSFRKVGAS